MTAYQLISALPPVTLEAGDTITVEAINPSTGATVTGVTVTQVAIYGVNDTPDLDVPGQTFEPVLPLFAPIPEQDTGT